MKFYTYRIIIEPDENNTFHGYVPALSGCHTWGRTLEETRRNIRDAIDAYLRSLKADGEKIPEDRGIELVETFPSRPARRKSPVYA
ncbi:MAG TPA: type II toxin-antitoxin system HicB family antitoxin [Candidatus Paceibacterota bacterium]